MKTTTKNRAASYQFVTALKFSSGLVVLVALFLIQPFALADGSGNADVVTGVGCMEDQAGFGLNCTANDVSIANITNVTILDDGCAFPGDTVTFSADFDVLLTAQARHDVGMWFVEDGDPNGDGAVSGTCTVATPAYAPDPPWLDLDGLGDALPGSNKPPVPPIQDTCGDINATHNPLYPNITLTVVCLDTSNPRNGKLNVPNCTSWRQPGANKLCTTPEQAFPGAPSKCRCDPIGPEIPIDIPGELAFVDKVTLDIDGEPLLNDSTAFDFDLTGDDADLPVSFTLSGAQAPYEGPVLDAGTYNLAEGAESGWELVSAICESPGADDQDLVASGGDLVIPGGGSWSCTFTNKQTFVADPSIEIDKYINLPADNADGDGSGDVSVDDVLTYHFTVTNTGNVVLNPVTVSDSITGPVTCLATSLEPAGELGDSTTCTATYTVQVGDLGGNINNTATATGTPPIPLADVTAQDTETVPVPQPSLSVDKPAPTNADEDGSGDVSVGDTLTYTITATNDGTANLTNVVVSDPMLTPTGGTTPCANVAPSGTCTLVGTYKVTAADVTAGQIDNTGTADSVQTEAVTDDETVSVPQPSLAVDKPAPTNADEDGSGDVSVGDTLTYTITATNDGTANLTNVVVSDPMLTPTGGTTPCANVAPSGTCTLVGTYKVTAADVTAGQIDNTGTADSVQTEAVTDDETVSVPQPSLAVDKPAPTNADEDGSGDVSVGDTLTYTITATNDGTANLTNVVVSDPMLTPTGGTTPCANVAPSGTCTLVGTYKVTAADVTAGQIDNTGTADSVQTEAVTDDETVSVPQPSLAVDKPAPTNADEDGSGDVSVGDTLTYTITATNDGTANLTNVVVSDPMLTPTGGTTPCANVAPSGTCTLVGTYKVTAADVTAGQIDNTGTADSVQTEAVTDDETVSVPQPSLAVDKPAPTNADEDGSGDVSVGDTLTYTITATNDGTANLTNVVVSDPMLTPTGGTTPCANVAPSGTCTLVGTYKVTAADVTAGQIDNTGTADSVQTEAVTDDETVSVPQPSLAVDKPAPTNADEDGSGDVSVGDTLTYTITATNDGTANLTNVVVSDPMLTPTGGTTPCANVAPSGTCTLVGTYKVTAADVTAGQIDNTGTADSVQTEAVTDDETVSVPQPSLAVDKPAPTNADEDGSGDVSVGDTLTYTITATNDGTANLTNVVVSDPMLTPTGGTTPCANVAPSGTCTLVGTYKVTAADVTAGQIDNTGTADSVQTEAVTDDETVSVPQPSLAVDKPAPTNADEDGSGDVSVGDTLTYTITATNDGTANLTNVVVSDPMLTPTGGTTPCANVAPSGTCTLVGTYKVTAADVTAGQIDNTGTADSVQTEAVTDDETVSVPQPSLAVDKPAPTNADEDGSGDVSVGDTLTYTITATNDGTANLTNVVVSDPMLTPTGGTTPCANVAPSGTCTLVGTYKVTAADVTAGQIDNTGTADSVQTEAVTDDETVSVPQPSLAVDKPAPTNADEDGSGDVSVGDTLTYTITATNDGTANLTNVVVSDPMLTPTGGTTPCANVAPSGTCTLVGTYKVTAADVTAGQIDNTGTADSVQTEAVTDDETVSVPQPSLAVDKPAPTNADEDGSGDVSVGDTLTYTITATNDGTANLTNVVVSDPMLTPTGGTTPCANVAPSGTCTLVGTYKVTAADVTAGQIDNTGTADSVQTEAVTDDETVSVPQPSLAVDKPAPTNADEDGSGDVSVGDTLTYTITATNDGTANLTNVVVSDPMLTPTGGTTPCANVAPSGTCTLVGTYKVTAADVTAGQIDNTGTADSVQTEAVTDDETVSVPQPSLAVDKPAPTNADEDGSGDVSVGDTLTYTITATNDGTANLTNVVVSDPMLTPTGGTTPCANVAPSGTCTLVGTYKVTAADVTAGQIDNTGTADSVQTEAVTDDETVSVPQPSLAVDKPAPTNADEDGSGDVSVGDTLTYTITATNDGTANLTNVVVSDPMLTPTGGTTPCANVAPSGTCTLVGTYKVTAADVTAGQIDNTGTADSVQTEAVTDDETVSVPQPSLAVDKPAPTNADEDGSGDVSVGDTLTYTITATNDGTANLTNVVVSDPMLTPTGGTTPCANVAPSGTCTLVGTYKVTAADVTAGQIDNTGTADSVQTEAVTDDETVSVPQPSLAILKTGDFNDEDDDSYADPDETITYTFTVTNTGTANLTNVTVTDPLPGLSSIDCASSGTNVIPFLPTESAPVLCRATYAVDQDDIDAGKRDNTGTADSVQTGPVSYPATVPLPQNLVISIVKTFAADDVIAGGTGSSFTLLVTNTGNVTLSPAAVTDTVDARLTVNGVAVTTRTAAGGETCAVPSQSVSCTIPTLAVGESATITVDFAALPGALGDANIDGTVDVEATVPNLATVTGTAPLGDTVTDIGNDSIDIHRDINLSIVKTFDPNVIEVPQGTNQIFTIEVSNAGLSDADNVVVTDTVNAFLDISDPGSVVVTSSMGSSGSCDVDPSTPPPLATSDITCTVDIPVGGSVLITVTYTVAPFLDGPPDYGTDAGSEFIFVFDNGSILEGSASGLVTLTEADGMVTTYTGDTKNDFFFDPPGDDDPAFLMHLSCSDPFFEGWGSSGGPVEGVDVNWQIDYFSIARYKRGGEFHRNCGNVVGQFDVLNTATAVGVDYNAGDDGVENVTSDPATVTIKEGVRLDRFQKKLKHGSVDMTNFTGESKAIQYLRVTWPVDNGEIRQVNLGGLVIWEQGNEAVYSQDGDSRMATLGDYPLEYGELCATEWPCDPAPWLVGLFDRTLAPEITEKLTVHFTQKAAAGVYDISVGFIEGTLLDLRIAETTQGGKGKK